MGEALSYREDMKLFSLVLVGLCTFASGAVLRDIESSHVEHSALSAMLMRRALKIAVESFDPYKIYLSKDEVYPLIHLSDRQLSQLAAQVRSGNYSGFDPLFSLFAKAAMRAAEHRAEILNDPPALSTSLKGSFVTQVDDLKEQQRAYIASCAKAAGVESAPWPKIVRYFDKRLAYHEKGYRVTHWSTQIIKACAKSFDPHTAYYTSDETQQMRAYLEKGFEGVGIGFSENLDGIYVSTLAEKAPARRSGKVAIGDRLLAIGSNPVDKMSFPEVLRQLRRSRSPVHFTFSNERGAYRISLEKAALEVKEGRFNVAHEPTQGGIIAKIALHTFYESDVASAAHDIRFALRRLAKVAPIQGVVLDLRENPGGFLSQGVKVAGTFMHSGPVAVARCRNSRDQILRDLSCQCFYRGPLVVLVSKASASCSEIVAGTLQDYGLAIVVGDEQTFGKATIQDQTMTSSTSSSYRVTMGRYFTVSGRSPQIEGVRSDIVVPTHYHKMKIGERHLSYPLAPSHTGSVFKDPLSDVHASKRSWLKSRYLPHVEKREVKWRLMLDQLRTLSAERLASSEAYQEFLSDPNLAREDLVMREAVDILKDMQRISCQKSSN